MDRFPSPKATEGCGGDVQQSWAEGGQKSRGTNAGIVIVSSRICKLDSRVEWVILIETYWNYKPTHSANAETLWDNLVQRCIRGLWLQVVWANEDHSWNDFQDATVLVTVKRPAPRQKSRVRNHESPQIQTEARKTIGNIGICFSAGEYGTCPIRNDWWYWPAMSLWGSDHSWLYSTSLPSLPIMMCSIVQLLEWSISGSSNPMPYQ